MVKGIVFFDIDGTLLSPISFTFEDSTKRALRELKDAGYLLGIATGRGYHAAKNVGALDLIDWDVIVLNNGQRVFDKDYNLLYEKFIEPEVVEEFLRRAHERDIAVLAQGDDWHFYSEINDYVREVHKELGDLPTPEEYDSSIGIYTLLAYGTDYSFMDGIDELRYVQVVGPYADVILKGENKEKGIRKALDHLNLDEYIAMGDSANDLEMARGARVFIATHEVNESLLPFADYQIESKYDEIEKGVRWILNVLDKKR